MNDPTTELLLDSMVDAYTNYKTLLMSIHYTDGDRAWAELERRKEHWLDTSRQLALHAIKLEEEETKIPY